MVGHDGFRLLRVVGILHTEGNFYRDARCAADDPRRVHFNWATRSVREEPLQPVIGL